MKYTFVIILFVELFMLLGCSYHYEAKEPNKNSQSMLSPDMQVSIEGLGPCYDDVKHPININTKEPISILVHGCYASDGEFRSLSDVLAFHSQQSFCFRYDDRDSLDISAKKLTKAINELATYVKKPDIHIIAHSMGGLVARKALSKSPDNIINENIAIKMVTISTPFSGIQEAKACANPYVRYGTLGIHDLVCWMISGDKWYEITPASDFIQKPGELSTAVSKHILIATDEKDSCRYTDELNNCLEDDYVFSLNEQKLPNSKSNAKQKDILIKAGHVGIVGKYKHSPKKLIKALQSEGFIPQTSPLEIVLFNNLVSELFTNKGNSWH
jgi:pimeloyl-ACP methyl ester carboxylesterase